MAWLRPTLAILIALFGSIADAGPQAVPRKYQAGFYLEGCKDFLAGRSNFLSGRCVGAIEVLDELGSDNKLFCPPQTISNLEQVRIIVTYIEALPKRMMEGFGLLWVRSSSRDIFKNIHRNSKGLMNYYNSNLRSPGLIKSWKI